MKCATEPIFLWWMQVLKASTDRPGQLLRVSRNAMLADRLTIVIMRILLFVRLDFDLKSLSTVSCTLRIFTIVSLDLTNKMPLRAKSATINLFVDNFQRSS